MDASRPVVSPETPRRPGRRSEKATRRGESGPYLDDTADRELKVLLGRALLADDKGSLQDLRESSETRSR